MKLKFRKKYVLAEGYPWAYGTRPFMSIGVNEEHIGVNAKNLNWPMELNSADLPKYRLILERIGNGSKKKESSTRA